MKPLNPIISSDFKPRNWIMRLYHFFTSSIVASVCCILDLICNWHENKVSHKLDNITGSPVFSGFLVIFLVEFTDKFLKDRSHAVVIQSRQADNVFSSSL